ncbi:MAG TPA: 3'-5' exonuclease [Chloroflexota bacterium]|nr:3'-5' exonuclease [Chloroflexota bacterium]
MIELDSPLSRVTFVAVDVETTGLDAERDDIVEIGAVKIREGEIAETFSTLVAIDRTIPFTASRIHGINNSMLVGQPRIGEALQLLFYFAEDGAFVEHSWKAFDIAFLERVHGPLGRPALNTCTLSRHLFPHMRSHSLESCCKRYGIANAQAHRALPDARATAEVLQYLLKLCGPRYPRLSDLLRVCAVERPRSENLSRPAGMFRARGS